MKVIFTFVQFGGGGEGEHIVYDCEVGSLLLLLVVTVGIKSTGCLDEHNPPSYIIMVVINKYAR